MEGVKENCLSWIGKGRIAGCSVEGSGEGGKGLSEDM